MAKLETSWGMKDGCILGDFVADTPNQHSSNNGCPVFPSISCDNGPNGDMFMNFMDYVSDRCMVMFTKGQVNRMNATLEGPRSSFLNGSGGISSTKPKLLPIPRITPRHQGGEGSLTVGDSRTDLVKDLQEILVYLGYSLGNSGPNKNGVTGIFDFKTAQEVKKFQSKNKDVDGKQLDVDGDVGDRTGGALNHKVEAS